MGQPLEHRVAGREIRPIGVLEDPHHATGELPVAERFECLDRLGADLRIVGGETTADQPGRLGRAQHGERPEQRAEQVALTGGQDGDQERLGR